MCKRYQKNYDDNYSDDDDVSYDSYDDNDPYAKSRGPEYPEYLEEITTNYETIVEFIVFVQSIPPIDMCLRNKKLFNSCRGDCFCPFGKKVGNFKEHFPEQNEPKYSIFLEKECKRDKFTNYQALIQHCDSTGDWYHEMYATFLRSFYELPPKTEKKQRKLINCTPR